MASVTPLRPPPHDDLAIARAHLRRLYDVARGHKRALVLTHDNPDPDSMASALALAFLLERGAGVRAQVAYGGIIGRAENRALVRVLKLAAVPLSRVDIGAFDLFGLVDTQPSIGNHSLPPGLHVDLVIDHHPPRVQSQAAAFHDVGGEFGATSTILASYVRAAGLRPPRALATALFYGIKSDTRDLHREFVGADVDNYLWLFPFADKAALASIEHPELPSEYFAAYHSAYEKARLYGHAVVVDLGELYAPDLVAEIAERMLSLEGMKWSLALGTYGGQLFLSVRTSDRRMNAGRLVRRLMDGRPGGSAGGHGAMAGARLPLPKAGARRLSAAVVRDFLRAFDVGRKKGVKLVP